jgi:hypothetical protein
MAINEFSTLVYVSSSLAGAFLLLSLLLDGRAAKNGNKAGARWLLSDSQTRLRAAR